MRPDPSAPVDVLTIAEFAALPPGEDRVELVRGRVVREPLAGYGPGRVAARVIHLLNAFVSRNDLGDVLSSETGFVLFRDPPTVRAPDAITLLREGDALEGGEVLPGFRVAVADLFGRGMPDLS